MRLGISFKLARIILTLRRVQKKCKKILNRVIHDVISGLMVKKIGYSNIMLLSLVLYAVRIAGYSLFTRPEWFLLLEALKPFWCQLK